MFFSSFGRIITMMLLGSLISAEAPRSNHLDNDEHGSKIPHIDVQSTFIESWETNSNDLFSPISGHTIVINTGWKSIDTGIIEPLNASDKITIQVRTENLSILVPTQDGFRRQELIKNQPVIFPINQAGRFSFTIPLDEIHSSEYNLRLPALLIRSDYLPRDQWLVVHPDYDCLDRFSKITGDHLLSVNPDMDRQTANATALMISKLSALSKMAVPSPLRELQETTFVKRDHAHSSLVFDRRGSPRYNHVTNRLSSYMIQHPESHDFRRYISAALVKPFEFLVSGEFLSIPGRDLPSHLKKRQVHQWWETAKADLEADKTTQVDHFDIQDLVHYGISKREESNQLMFVYQKRGFNGTFHSILESPKKVMMIIQNSLQKLGVFIKDLAAGLQNFFSWKSIAQTHRFLVRYHHIYGAFQYAGTNFAGIRIKEAFTKIIHSTDNSFQRMMSMHGVTNASLPALQAQKATETAKESLGIDHSTSTGDARVNHLHDVILSNIDNLTPVNETTTHANIMRLMNVGSQMGEELLNVIPNEYKEHMEKIVIEFKSGTSFMDKSMARILKLIRSVSLFVESLVGYVASVMNRFFDIMVELLLTIIELPIYIPLVTQFWKRIVSPGSGDLSLLSLYSLIGSIPSTLFYKLYRHQDPVSEKDAIALESNKIPQLFLYTWNTHPLTHTTDEREKRRRTAVFDWVPKMSAAYMLSFAAITGFLGPEPIPNPSTPAELATNKNIEMTGIFFKYVRVTVVYLLTIWVYPVTQLESPDPIAIELDMKYPEPRVQLWWYSYEIGLAARVLSLVNYSKFAHIADLLYTLVVGVGQGIASHLLSYEILKRINLRDWKRVAVTAVGITTWESDTASCLANLIPDPVTQLAVVRSTVAGMVYGYELRAHLMMGLHVVGVVPPVNETLADHQP